MSTRMTITLLSVATALLFTLAAAPAEAARKPVKKSPREQQLATACDEDDGQSCRDLALMLIDAADVDEKRARRALSLLDRGCTLKDGPACARLALEMDQGTWAQPDAARMADLAGRGCGYGDMDACVQLGEAYLGGRGVEQSFQKAIPNLKQACQAKVSRGCFLLGAMMENGQGGPVDVSRAQGMYERACNMEDGEACRRLGELFLTGKAAPAAGEPAGQPQLKKASRFFTDGCDVDDDESCAALGRMRRAGQGMGMDEDVALDLFDKACGLGNAWACVEAGSYPSDGTITERLRQRCQNGKDGASCFAVGGAWLKEGDEEEAERGAAMLQKACDGGVPRACYSLGLALEKGKLLPKDLARSTTLMGQACKGGIQKACNR